MHERHAESLAQTEADQLAIPMVDVSLSSSGTSDEIPVGEQSVPVSSDSQTVGAASFEYPALQRRLSLPTGRPTYPSNSALSLRCSMQQWALSEPNVPKSAVTSLLRVLKLYHEDLPITYSTLLPKPELTYGDMCGGTYVHLENYLFCYYLYYLF